MYSSAASACEQHDAVNVRSECQCKRKHISKKCATLRHQETSDGENTKSPTDPVYLDIDRSYSKIENNPHSDQKMPFSADFRPKIKHWLHKGRVALFCTPQTRGVRAKTLCLQVHLYNTPSTNPPEYIASFQ